MIDPPWAMVAAAAAVAIGDQCNRRVFGWLPDDPPRPGRKQHTRPVPLAGVLLVPAILPWCIDEGAFLPGLAIVLAAATGYCDDRLKERGDGLDWRIKAIGLAVAAGLVASISASAMHEPVSWGAAFLLVFALTNAVNFLDNTDGVAASLAATSLLWLAYGPMAAGAAIAGWVAAAGFAALGFLPWNWPRPSVFLGDAGAYALGIATGAAVVQAMRFEVTALLTVAVPLLDFVQVVLARLVLGVPPWVGDRRHLTHIVQNLGLPRWAVAPLFAAIASLLAYWQLR